MSTTWVAEVSLYDAQSDTVTDPERSVYQIESSELFVWNRIGDICGFELFYRDVSSTERSLRWCVSEGYSFNQVDSEHSEPPVMLSINDEAPPLTALSNLIRAATNIPKRVREFVAGRIAAAEPWHSGITDGN